MVAAFEETQQAARTGGMQTKSRKWLAGSSPLLLQLQIGLCIPFVGGTPLATHPRPRLAICGEVKPRIISLCCRRWGEVPS